MGQQWLVIGSFTRPNLIMLSIGTCLWMQEWSGKVSWLYVFLHFSAQASWGYCTDLGPGQGEERKEEGKKER